MRWTLFSRSFARCSVAFLLLCAPPCATLSAEDFPGDGDPGLALRPPSLSAEEANAVRAWFKELGSDDFDVRDRAVSKIVGKGPAVLPIAKEFFNDPDREVAALARGLRARILTKFDGFLPTDSVLREALAKQGGAEIPWHKGPDNTVLLVQTLREISQKYNIALEVDQSAVNVDLACPAAQVVNLGMEELGTPGKTMVAGDKLQILATICGAHGIPRGDVYLVTSAETAQRLALQRYTFDWSGLELGRDEAARVEKELAPFFPSTETELHSGSSALLISGTEESIQRAARLIALLKPKSPDAIWPKPVPADDAALLKKLSAPAPIQISANSPQQAVDTIRQQQHDVFLQNPNGSIVSSPAELQGNTGVEMTSLNLNFNQSAMPLGLLLRWCERRAKLTELNQPAFLAYGLTPDNHIVMQPRATLMPSNLPVCGADVAFLYKTPGEFNTATDAAVRQALLDALSPHLDLYPALDTALRLRVIRGRLLVQGSAATLRRILALVGEWRNSGKPPEPPAWRRVMDEALNAPVEWDGRGLTGGKVLSTLRKIGKVNILLEDSPTNAAHFELLPQDSELLPPGHYAFKELLNDLVARAKAQWSVELGAVVLTPK